MSYVFYTVLSLALFIYGIIHLRNYKSSHLKMGYVEVNAIITKQYGYHPPKPGSSSRHYRSVFKFSLNGTEHEVDVYTNGGPPDDADIGKEKIILVNTNNPKDAIFADFENQKNVAIGIIIASIAGVIGFGIMAFKNFTK